MSINYLASGSSFNEWTPDLKTIDGVLQVDESKLPSNPEGFIFVIKGLTEEVKFEKVNRTIRNGDLIWFTTDGEVHSYSSTGSTNKYKDLSGKPVFGSMAFVKDTSDDKPKVRIKNKWVPAPEPVFQEWYPEAVEGDFAAYCTTYVPKVDEPITGVLSQIGNRLDVIDYNTGNTDHVTQYVLGKQNLNTSQKVALYFKFPNVPYNFNAIDLSCGFYRTPCGLAASPLQQEKLFVTDGMVVANEIVIDGFAGVSLPSQLRRNFNGQLKDLEFCIVWEPTLNAWTGSLSLYISQQKDVPLASVAVTDFFVDSIIMGLNISIPTANVEVDASIEILTLPTVVHTGLAPFVSSNEIIPIIFEDSYPEGRFGRLYEVFGLDKPSLLAELNLLVNNGDIIWFGSDGKARQFFQNGFSGKWVDLQGVPNFGKVALSNSYMDLFDLPHLGSASEKDIEYFTDLITASLLAAKTHTDNEVSILNSNLDNKVDKETGKVLSTNDYTDADKTKLASLESSHYRGVFINEAALSTITDPVAGDYADIDAGAGSDAERWIYDVSDAKWVTQESASSLTASQVKQLYESNADTNAFTDDDKSRLSDTVQKSANLSDLENASTARQNLGLGTGATKDVGTGDGNVMEVGTFGIGKALNYDPDITLEAQHIGGFGSASHGSRVPIDGPDLHVGKILYVGPPGWGTQLWFSYNEGKAWFRNKESGKSYESWKELLHSGNTRTTTGNSTTYPMSQKAVTDALGNKVDKVQAKEIVTANKTLTAADRGKLLIINSDSITITMPANSNFTIDIAKMDESFTTVVQCAGTNKFREGTSTISVIRDVSITNSGIAGKEWLAIGAYEV